MSDELLVEVLEQARRHGHFGPGPIDQHIALARRLGEAIRGPVGQAIDLGAGGGVPGLVLAFDGLGDHWLLVDRRVGRVDDLLRAIGRLELAARVEAMLCDVERLGRNPRWRGQADLVTARSFGPPADVAELAAPLLRVTGQLLVSEPPEGGGDRWNRAELGQLGMQRDEVESAGLSSFTQLAPCPERFPRRHRRPPLW